MKKILLASFILLSATAMAEGITKASGEIDAIGKVISQVTINSTCTLLDFGVMVPGEIHDTSIDDGCSGATIGITGLTGARVYFEHDETVTLTHDDGDFFIADLSVDGESNTGVATVELNQSSGSFVVHGKMQDGAPDKVGTYTGTFTVSAYYNMGSTIFQ